MLGQRRLLAPIGLHQITRWALIWLTGPGSMNPSLNHIFPQFVHYIMHNTLGNPLHCIELSQQIPMVHKSPFIGNQGEVDFL